jgi:hypothetical protein
MVHKIINNRFRIFIESLILTILILLIGFSIGFYVEFSRTNSVINDYKDFEIEALDLKLQNYYYQTIDRGACEAALEQNFIFADDLYTQGLEIERYEEAGQITDDIKREKKRYVLLKTELWLNTLLLKEKCNADFDTIVYIYENEPNGVKDTQQKIISNVLKTIKEKRGNDVILIPIAGDPELKAIQLQLRIYEIKSLPSILINEEIVLEGYHSVDEIESFLK